jgi:hypothetical protein
MQSLFLDDRVNVPISSLRAIAPPLCGAEKIAWPLRLLLP